jgi:uncharacterized protein
MMNSVAGSHVRPAIAQMVRSYLWSPDPDILDITSQLREQFGFCNEFAYKLLYDVYRSLNERLFPAITDMELILTEACNLHCTYCFEKNIIGAKYMNAELARRAVDLLFDYSFRRRKLRITFFGGEPTLNRPVIEEVLNYVAAKQRTTRKEVAFHMTSNGTLINENMARFLAKHHVRVLLSIDGLKDTHDSFRVNRQGKGTFDAVIANALILKKYQPWIGTKMTVMPDTVERLYDDVKGLAELGINHFIIGAASGNDWSAESLKTLQDHLVKIKNLCRIRNRNGKIMRVPQLDGHISRNPRYGCQAARNSICVTADGEISPCARVLAINGKELVAHLGNIRFGIFKLQTRWEMVTCNKLRENCARRGVEKDFDGGCFAANFEETGDVFQPSLAQYRIQRAERLNHAH